VRSYLILFSVSFLFSVGMTPLVRRWATAWGAVDLPDGGRRIHQRPTPRLGGLAIYLAFLGALLCAPLLDNRVSQGLLANWRTVAAVVAAGTLVFVLGVYDDFRGANASVKISVQVIAAMILYYCGFRINALSSPFGGSWELPMALSFPLTAVWIVGITNAFNLIDGIDGLAAGASVFALLSLLVCSLAQGHSEISLLSIVLVGAVIGFLRYNFNPATIFLGDSGSLLLGFMAAALSLICTQKSPTLIAIAIPLVSFGLPVTEVFISIGRRFLSGAPLFQGDRRHIHHMLLHRGLTQRQTAILLYAICALFSLFGVLLLNPQRYTAALVFFVLGAGMVIGIQHLRYPEFNTLGQHFKQGVGRRRRVSAFYVQLRRTSDELRLTQTVEQVLAALAELSTVQVFDLVILELHQVPATVEAELRPTKVPALMTGTEGAAWSWNWKRGKAALTGTLTEHQCWVLRAPLINGQGAALGAITFHCDMTNDELTVSLDQVCDLLCFELIAALERLASKNQQHFGRNLQQAGIAA
jgi:UDP-GlcNAc:undecaprenyl-phosphate/decaprenyl-phosphate GlcNAc-1-phosphate transferase